MNVLIILLAAVGILLIWLLLQMRTLIQIHDTLAIIGNEELEILLATIPSTTLIDIREPEEFILGHIPGAINIPFMSLKERVCTLETKQPIVLIGKNSKKTQKLAGFIQKKRPDIIIQYIKGIPTYYPNGTFLINWL